MVWKCRRRRRKKGGGVDGEVNKSTRGRPRIMVEGRREVGSWWSGGRSGGVGGWARGSRTSLRQYEGALEPKKGMKVVLLNL